MTWSWSGDPSASDLDEVRFHLQDTDETDQLLSDEEINFTIDRWTDVVGTNVWAAAMCAETLAARFAREVSVSADGVSVAVEQLQQKYNDLALSLRDQHKSFTGAAGSPTGNGTIFDVEQDDTIRPLSFGKGMHDNIRGGIQDRGNAVDTPWFTMPEDAI